MDSTMEDKTNKLIGPSSIFIAFRYDLLSTDQGTGVSFLCMGKEVKVLLLKALILEKLRIKKR